MKKEGLAVVTGWGAAVVGPFRMQRAAEKGHKMENRGNTKEETERKWSGMKVTLCWQVLGRL